MTNERFKELTATDELYLTEHEVTEGWHFCWDFDGLLRNNNEEAFQCDCHPTRKVIEAREEIMTDEQQRAMRDAMRNYKRKRVRRKPSAVLARIVARKIAMQTEKKLCPTP